MPKPTPLSRADFTHFESMSTRWSDNDIYGHINNVQYYSYFDTAVNRYLITQAGLDIHTGTVIGLVVHSSCDYFAPAAFPDVLEAGVRVLKLGNSSVRYQVGIFLANENGESLAVAQGEFVHVYVDSASRKPVQLPASMQQALTKICCE